MSIEAPPATLSVQDLKRVKNSVIGNPIAKSALSRDAAFMRSLVECVDVASVAGSVGNEIRVEAAHIVASLSYGSESALETLLRLQTPRILIFALSQFTPTDPLPLRSAYARALRAIVASVAEILGPSEYGLRPETTGPMQIETKEALSLIFAIETLDILLPLLLSPSPQLATPIVQLLASATRSLHHRTTLSSYLPPSERLAANAAKSKKRGWEKIASPTSPSASLPGARWVVRVLVGLLARTKDVKLQEAALLGLVALAKENAGVAVPLARGMVYQPDLFGPPLALIHTLMRSRNVDVQLAACLCATHILRATHASSHAASTTHVFDYAQTTYAQVNRVVVEGGGEAVERRVRGCYILYHLTTDDRALCQFAYDRMCLDTLAGVVKAITPVEPKEGWDESESEGVVRLREASLTAIATLGLFNEQIRRAITDRKGAATNAAGVRYAGCQCVRVLARGVSVLRTTIVDSGLGMEVFGIVMRGARDRRVLNAALAAVCNIVMEFSPLRPIYLRKGLMPRLVQILNRSSDSSLRLNALWAVKNSLNRTTSETKRDMMSDLGWNRLFELLHDPDLTIQEQAYGIIRNLSSDEDGMEMVFQEMGQDAVLDTPSLADRTPTLIQALWALANLCSGPSTLTSSVLQKPQLLLNLRTCLAECGSEVRKPAVQCVLVLAQEHPRRRRALVDAGVVGTLRRLCEWGPTVLCREVRRLGAGVGASMDMDKEVYERARMALDWLEHGDGSGS
ncbi:ARM repeat-containing protein [Ephemerocybe angulata]|uniref:ARM repeat-containing protein n=1 Tax=Ephemerocybe angulata TaxID=980116 RepID=A0A8H6M0B7_9AGAR|nr:ARM repeat-containing protein [Tulosesus angulatus]